MEAKKNTWYPKRKQVRHLCPVCDGSHVVLDAKTKKFRKCVLCNGKGGYFEFEYR